ncbi:PREDICTED: uncharacterized protein LOC109483432 isoform X1 [Branchiostoma belcheri]|uniref:Uncharacterized protein LOC109483432 isoform X1 n=1 Tax=Branchiostoma belcheri TaxID=7741 RepID=A0A6P5A6Y7_BRABE|nr:PREDICTED: uncharacterized protein LOC109483432 isoform X1 [Branchiostoma belcheri]
MTDKPPPYAPPEYNGGYQNQGYAQMGPGYQPQQPGYPGGYGTGAPPGYQPLPQGMSQPSYMGTQTTVTVQPQPTTSVVVVGGCPSMQSWRTGRRLHVSRNLLRHRFLPDRAPVLPCAETEEMSQLWGHLRLTVRRSLSVCL